MAVPLEQFVKHLEDSGILDSDTLREFVPPQNTPKDAEELARELVRKKKLTKFQAEEIYRGKGKALVLGNYTILEKIGAGGMGQVFKAEHRRMRRIVAVKLLSSALMKDASIVARFEREMTAVAKLNHSNIVTAYDADTVNGVHLLVMEYVEGSDLAATVKKNGPLPLDKAVHYVLQAARGLEAAHAEGIVHRDIKPANLLLDKKGTVKILDMGLARIGGEAPGQADLTSTGAVMGTVDYMAPEQALNTKAADARADIYSLGCSLFYLLTGKATYDGDTLMAKLLAHRDQPIPSIRAALPDAPQQLETVFSRMVAKKVEDRYQTMSAVVADLERLASGQQPAVETRVSQTSTIEARAKETPSSGSRVETGLTDFLNDVALPPPVTVRSVKRRKAAARKDWFSKNRKFVLTGGGGLGAVILLAGIILSLRTKEGTLVVKVSEPDAEVQVLSEEGKLEITRKGEDGPITIEVDPGKHRLKVSKDGFEIFTDNFEIEARSKTSITARLVRLEDNSAKVAKEGAGAPTATGKPAADQPQTDVLQGTWVSLFNGKDLAGWSGDVGAMTVENGVLVNDGKRGHVIAPGDYQDATIEIEFRLANAGNSGLGICYSGSGDPSKSGLEIQMLDDDGYPEVKDAQKCGSIYQLAAAKPGQFKRWPEWNQFRVATSESAVRVELNGILVTETTRAALKQTNPQHEGVSRTSGKVCLFPHTGRSEYRSFRIRPAGPMASAQSPQIEGWKRLDSYWKITPQEITGSTGNTKLDFSTFLCSNRIYRDFELICQVWLKKGNSGIQIRSELVDQNKWVLRGPQVDIGSKYWGCLYGEQTTGMMQAAPTDFESRFVKPDGFNDILVRCIGKHVTIKINGQTSVDGEFPNMADEGIIGLQLHAGETEVVFRDIRLVEVGSGRAPPKDAGVFERHAYKFFPEVLTWHQAKSRCEEMGGHLAIVTSQAENTFVNDLAKKGIPQMGEWDGAWLGATDEQKEGDWRWIDGKPLEFNAWGPGQPNNKQNAEHYLLLFLPRSEWSDQPTKSVQHTAYFVCEWDSLP